MRFLAGADNAFLCSARFQIKPGAFTGLPSLLFSALWSAVGLGMGENSLYLVFWRQMHFHEDSVRWEKSGGEQQAVLVLLGQGWKKAPTDMLEKFWARIRLGKILKVRVQGRMVSWGKHNGTEGNDKSHMTSCLSGSWEGLQPAWTRPMHPSGLLSWPKD